ncbi:hypothetical protein JM79_2368 [Gramella sp. Hel_I_59]|uniref:ORC-CDC6 family AAA ATPase n=1 Tax=Gramella sp. Hel_I_59 TaxID=1249978 RepID=UPI001152BA0E|nr:hypothetical protein [Gramella sp. Hel_I_59]TQI71435.1 hypothetical protein JM79_2368 [Gramella sp. Hel_I_59]
MIDKLLLYDTFNARYFSFKDISESFVVNDEYRELAKDSSMLLMGSRGCGKTTLLKMLTPAGLAYWNDEESSSIKDNIKFTGVYVPSDIQWKNQFDYLRKHLKNENSVVEIIIEFLFSCNINIALCKTFKSILDFQVSDPLVKIQKEYKISKGLISNWELPTNTIPNLDNVELEILQRVRQINNLIKKLIFSGKQKDFRGNLPNYVFNEFFDLTKLGCKVVEENIDFKDNMKWALCFDELEIVPKFLQMKLVSFLRSVDQKFIFKLTTTPLFDIENNEIDVTQGNDFSSVKLWVYDEEGLNKWSRFSARLIEKKIINKYDSGVLDVNSIFGEWILNTLIVDELNSLNSFEKEQIGYKKNSQLYPSTAKKSALYYLFKRLAIIDDSFKQFIDKRGINSDEPFTNDPALQKSVFLKYKVDAIYRLIYKNRTRRNPPIHFGVPYIYEICDGNPRLLIGLINEILNQNNSGDFPISKNSQSSVISVASKKYFNLLKNHPDSTITVNNSDFNLATDLIDKIGNFFFQKLVSNEFQKSSPTTFIVDVDINAKIVALLETALHLGAIVYLDPVESLSKTGVINKRFRLSAFLTPRYKIPNRIISFVKLSVILRGEKPTNHQTEIF